MDYCKFCSSKSLNMHITLYGVYISDRCHNLLRKHDVKKDLESLEQKKQEYMRYLKKIAPERCGIKGYCTKIVRDMGSRRQDIEAGYMYIPHYSKTEQEIKKKNFFIRISAFLAPNSYKKLFDIKTQEKINSELNEINVRLKETLDEIKRLKQEEEEYIERNKEVLIKEKEASIEEYAKCKMLQEYPERYCKIIELAKRQNILLYEYYLDEYPPDWNYRAKMVKTRDENRCQNCGTTMNLHVHHKIPVIEKSKFFFGSYFSQKRSQEEQLRKGNHFLDNLITLCSDCHLKKHNRQHWNWANKNKDEEVVDEDVEVGDIIDTEIEPKYARVKV